MHRYPMPISGFLAGHDGGISRALRFASTSIPAGNTVANTTSETAFASSYTLPAGQLAIGDVLEVNLCGRFGTTILAPTLRGRIKLAGTALIDTGALTLLANLTNNPWHAHALLTVMAIGASGSLECAAALHFSTSATAAITSLVSGGAVTINTAAASALTVTAQFSAADAANTITLRQMAVKQLR